MTGPQRQLPPLLVKILGDNKHALSHIQQVIKEVKNLQNLQKSMAAGTTGNSAAAIKQIKDAVRGTTQACLNAVARNVNNAAKSVATMNVSGKAVLKSAVRGVVQSIVRSIATIVQRQAAQLANTNVAGKGSLRDTLRQLVKDMIQAATSICNVSLNKVLAAMAGKPMLQGYIRKQIRDIIKNAITAITAIIQVAIMSGIANMSTKGISKALGAAIAKAIKNAIKNFQFPGTPPTPPPGGRKGMLDSLSGGSMMGARADIYMHQGTLQSMMGMTKSLVTPYAQVENYTVQMEAFAGSAQEAQKAVEQLQKFAIASPYKLEGVLDAATTMMKYGAETQHAIEMTKLLGDVAAGNTNKLELMALAVGQAEALGRLQGQELRQMVNAGFNPLTIAARELAGPNASDEAIKEQMLTMQDAMRKGKLDAGIIKAALEIATAKGGDFAGLTEKQATTLTGLAAQITETLDLAAIEIVKVFAEDLRSLMKTVKQYVGALVDWMKANKEIVKEWVLFGIALARNIALFTILALSIAYTKWVMGSFFTVISAVLAIFNLMKPALIAVASHFKLTGNAALMGWLKMLGPIALVIAAVIALSFLLQGLIHKNGFSGVIKDWVGWLSFFLGFFWNFSHNITHIFSWISTNWRLMLADMVMSLFGTMLDIAQLVAKLFGQDETLRKFREDTRSFIAKDIMGAQSTSYDNSMLKTDLPSMGDLATGQLEFLKPFIKPDEAQAIKDKPDIDFKKFIGTGGDDGVLGKNFTAAPDHAVRGSSEHAVRMYEYGEKARASQMAEKLTHEKKTETLLSKIEANTRPKNPTAGAETIETAGLSSVTF